MIIFVYTLITNRTILHKYKENNANRQFLKSIPTLADLRVQCRLNQIKLN